MFGPSPVHAVEMSDVSFANISPRMSHFIGSQQEKVNWTRLFSIITACKPEATFLNNIWDIFTEKQSGLSSVGPITSEREKHISSWNLPDPSESRMTKQTKIGDSRKGKLRDGECPTTNFPLLENSPCNYGQVLPDTWHSCKTSDPGHDPEITAEENQRGSRN